MQAYTQQLINYCGKLTFTEFNRALNARWPFTSWFPFSVSIFYSFNTSSHPSRIFGDLDFFTTNDFLELKMVPANVQLLINQTLILWEKICDGRVSFVYDPTLYHENGLRFSVSNQFRPDTLGVTYSNWTQMGSLRTFHGISDIIISANIQGSELRRTIGHEIGHGLGIGHFHDIESVRNRLNNTPQGKACSIMLYPQLLGTLSNCYSEPICENSTHALSPGPLDEFMCQQMYKPINTLILEAATDMVSKLSVFIFFNGSFETLLSSFLSHLNYQNKPLFGNYFTALIAKLSNIILYSQTQITMPVSYYSMFLELTLKPYNHALSECIKYFRLLTNVYYSIYFITEAMEEEQVLPTTLLTLMLISVNFLMVYLCNNLGKKLANGTNKLSFFNNASDPINAQEINLEI